MATDTSKITGAADDLSDKLTKGGGAAKTLGVEIAAAIASLDGRVSAIEAGGGTQPPIQPPAMSPDGSVLKCPPDSGALSNSYGSWTFGTKEGAGPDYNILLNAAAISGNGIELHIANGGKLYALNSAGETYLYDGSWSSASGGGGGGTPNPDKGVITNFAASNGSYFNIGTTRVQVENASKSYSLTNPDQYTLRFELHPGDVWPQDAASNNPGCDRSEVDGWPVKYSEGQETTCEFALKIDATAPNTAAWMNFAQTHHDTPEPGHVPMSFGWYNGADKFSIVGCHSNGDIPPWTDAAKTERGRWYQFKITVMTGNNGHLYAWKDGAQVQNYNGPLGRGPASKIFWKWGLYRGNNVAENLAMTMKNIYVH